MTFTNIIIDRVIMSRLNRDMKKYLTLLSVIILGACGFEPMHGSAFNSNGTNIKAELSQVKISNIPNKEGQFLRNALIDRFYGNDRPINPKYRLDITPIVESTYNLDITVRADVTRKQLSLSTKMSLIDNDSGKILLERPLKSSASYNVLISEFATRVSKNNTRENVLDDLARQAELQISLYLKRDENK